MNRTNMAYWWPILKATGVSVPRTEMVESPDLTSLLDGVTPKGYRDFAIRLTKCAEQIGYPVFLRSGYGSGKHEARRTCLVNQPSELMAHVCAIVEWSNMVDILGLPTSTWAIRERLITTPLAIARCGLPIVPEARIFTDEGIIRCIHSYWPPEALKQQWCNAQDDTLAKRLAGFVWRADTDLRKLVAPVCGAFTEDWSVDCMLASDRWYVIDMAEASKSWHPEHKEKRTRRKDE